MNNAKQHTFLVLTKRPKRMAEFLSLLSWYTHDREVEPAEAVLGTGGKYTLPNVWIGITVENQSRVEERIPILLQIPAAVRFISVEPMLGPVDLTKIILPITGPESSQPCAPPTERHINALTGSDFYYDWHGYGVGHEGPRIHWVICGGEAGSNTYANQTGIYYKIGRLVHCHGRVALSTKDGTMNGGIRIAGLPFAASVGYHSINFGQVSYFDYAENSIGLMGYAIGNEIPLYEAVDNGNRLAVLPTQIQNNTNILFSLVYTTA